MRLTDRPRTLLEMRPDLPWPERLQEVMDRGLARDAEERYQSAAQFGRDFAEAVSAMPSVAMTEGATMVIGAAGAPAAAPKAKPVPATRVAGRDDAKSPSNAASAPAALEKKSNMVPMAVGGVAIVIAGFLGVQSFMNRGDAPTVPDSGGGSPASVADAPAAQETKTPDATTPPNAPTGGSAMPVYQSANQPANQPSNPRLNRPANASPSTAPATTPATTPTTAAATETSTPMARISSWVVELEKEGGVTRARARAILGDAESLRSALSGTALSESWYVAVLANLTLEDQDGTCAAARQLKNLTRDQSRRLVADRILPDCS